MDTPTYKPDTESISKNPIWTLLDNCQIPWLETEKDLVRSKSVTTDSISGDRAIEIESHCPLFKNMYKPLRFSHVDVASTILPPKLIWGIFAKTTTNTRAQLDEIRETFSQILGKGKDSSASNTYSITWRSWPAKIELTVWPKELNRHYQRAWTDPDGDDACHLYINPGLALNATEEELFQFKLSLPIVFVQPNEKSDIKSIVRTLSGVEPPALIEPSKYYRRIKNETGYFSAKDLDSPGVADLRLATDKSILYQACETGMRLFPIEFIESVYVERIKPAKGGGGAYLRIKLRVRKNDHINIELCTSNDPDGLNNFAGRLAKLIGRKLELSEYSYDA